MFEPGSFPHRRHAGLRGLLSEGERIPLVTMVVEMVGSLIQVKPPFAALKAGIAITKSANQTDQSTHTTGAGSSVGAITDCEPDLPGAGYALRATPRQPSLRQGLLILSSLPSRSSRRQPACARWASARQPSLASRAKEIKSLALFCQLIGSGLPSRSSRQQPACARWASARQPSLASRAKAGGGRRTRTFEVVRRLIYSQLPLPLGTLPRPTASQAQPLGGGGSGHG